ncbi:EAL domain-containing protein [Halanaerobacter jeridensis]|uniref:EAL domain-containing protein (Putative c-di-GMP-specific phosphodiesterase class I) n=1 Tax=Halanaerobacter jeridensis TaxID=706427 RepID=A0A939BNN0_9FIRM|nr:EAL domain-containing protein [Halanaerobacter jeridensis]MBM7555772.1 EAL domain-containing protein (putative c-di-GMP-specific phosphodiesterase class I) [Halanaerobacter jeridensis]
MNLNYNFIKKLIHQENNKLVATFKNYTLYTALQPIFSLAHKRVIGYEGLVRVKDQNNNWISPAKLFNLDFNQPDIILLDRLCRYIHTHNFKKLEPKNKWLFLNVHPEIINNGSNYGSFFKNLLSETKLEPEEIVIEVVEKSISDTERLAKKINYYKDLGCLIAIDDFGTGMSNFDRVWSLNPDIIKLDQSLLFNAINEEQREILLPKVISLLRQAGSLVLIEGVENKSQVLKALDSGSDFVQGYYFAKPKTNFSKLNKPQVQFEKLLQEHKKYVQKKKKANNEFYNRYHDPIKKVIKKLKNGQKLAKSLEKLLEDEKVARAYLLSKEGIQIGDVVSKHELGQKDKQYKPLKDAENADWSRKKYLKQAVQSPNQLQITEPYFSINGGHMCITLSIMFETEFGPRILCCDLID